MKTGAVVVAAGKREESGMLPLDKAGRITLIQRIVETLKAAGVAYITVVTGSRAQELERALKAHGLIFLHNPDYENTQMFDSAKIGFRHLRDQCDRIALLPADIVMINKETIQKLMAVEAEAVIPLCNNEKGHPIVLSRMAVTEILRYDRGGGVRAAIQAIGVECTYIETQDWGILDDTYKDNRYLSMIEEHSRQLLRPVISVTIQREEAVINETLIMILDLTNSCESIKQASTWMRMSYSKALKLINDAEDQLGFKLVERHQGGETGGITNLTDKGWEVLVAYHKYILELQAVADEKFSYIKGILDE